MKAKIKNKKNIPKEIGKIIGLIFRSIYDVFLGMAEGMKEEKGGKK